MDDASRMCRSSFRRATFNSRSVKIRFNNNIAEFIMTSTAIVIFVDPSTRFELLLFYLSLHKIYTVYPINVHLSYRCLP